jgi:hypothetical protein
MHEGIDFVVTWVDMDDPRWRADFEKYSGRRREERNSTSVARFRDHGFLRYWFRGVERFAPWVRKVHFVTCGQKPQWLDETNPKLHLVDHKDFIPAQFLPIFNSASIEMWMHRIPGLGEQFVYFNDDFFITSPVERERFFRDGLPCDIAVFRLNMFEGQWGKRIRNNVRLIDKHFDKREVMARWHDKWFTPEYSGKMFWSRAARCGHKFMALRTPHNAQPYLKSTFEDLWRECEQELLETSTHRFRSVGDLTPELIRMWQVCSGQFTPYNTYKDTRMFPLVIRPRQAVRAVAEQSYKLVCLNDNVHIRNYEQVMNDIGAAFAKILPDKSTFEK